MNLLRISLIILVICCIIKRVSSSLFTILYSPISVWFQNVCICSSPHTIKIEILLILLNALQNAVIGKGSIRNTDMNSDNVADNEIIDYKNKNFYKLINKLLIAEISQRRGVWWIYLRFVLAVYLFHFVSSYYRQQDPDLKSENHCWKNISQK